MFAKKEVLVFKENVSTYPFIFEEDILNEIQNNHFSHFDNFLIMNVKISNEVLKSLEKKGYHIEIGTSEDCPWIKIHN